jgi:TRAP transporter TAXI family solute receptor
MDRMVKAGLIFASLVLAAVVLPVRQGAAQVARQSFDIVTGSAGGSYFPVGELIARIISHPPGLARCDRTGVCAPAGIIVSARSSDGAVANVLAVNDGSAASGLAQGSIVADAVAGRGPFRKAGPQSHVRVMADLFPETVQLVVVANSNIDSVAGLRGRRVSLGAAGSGGDVIAAEILSAFGVRNARVHREGYYVSAQLLKNGGLDAVFVLDAAPAPVIADLVAHGMARLVPITGKARERLVTRIPGLSAETIAAGTYRGTAAIETVGVHTLWIVNDSAPDDRVYGVVQALYNPANRSLLAQGPHPSQEIRLGDSVNLTSLPLHPGAARFYRDAGQLPRQAQGH